MALQNNWKWCSQYQGLYFAGFGLGSCPAGGTHSDPATSGTGDYSLNHSDALR
jgi:hypothetical protein